MKQIFVKKLNYKNFIKSNKSIIALTIAQIFFYIHLSLGFALAAYISHVYNIEKSTVSSVWILLFILSYGTVSYLKYKIKKGFV